MEADCKEVIFWLKCLPDDVLSSYLTEITIDVYIHTYIHGDDAVGS